LRLILLGPPGAGKGTQCKRIVEKFGIVHLSSGDILRAQRAAGTELGKKAQDYMDSGDLVPDELIIDMMIGAIKKAQKGYVLDGFPRTVVQAQGLGKALAGAGEKLNAVVNLEAADKEIYSRMTGRRSCPKCGEVYHITNLKPKIEGQCDKGCGSLIQRKDDKQEVVANRLKIYHEQTAVVVDYYSKKGLKIVNIDAAGPIDQVTAEIFDKLSRLKQ